VETADVPVDAAGADAGLLAAVFPSEGPVEEHADSSRPAIAKPADNARNPNLHGVNLAMAPPADPEAVGDHPDQAVIVAAANVPDHGCPPAGAEGSADPSVSS
jgi:hypothetical protein